MKNYLLRFLIAVVGLAVVQGFVYQALCATPESQKEAKSEQEKDWENTDRYSIDAIKAFLVRYPKGDMNDVIRERLVLMQKMKAIQDGNQSSLVVPFSMLAPWVEKWAEENNEKTVALYSAVKNGERTMYGVGTTLGEPGAVTIMRRGFMCAVLGQGTIIAFQTNGLEFTWPEGITFVSDVNSTLFFGVLPKKGGLVFLKGKGKFIKLDGKGVVLNDTVLMASSTSNEDRKNEAIKLLRTSQEDVQKASKRLAELVQDTDFGVRCQAAFTTLRLGQKFAEKIRSPELEKSLSEMVSHEAEAKKDEVEMDAEVTEGQGPVWTVKGAFPSTIRDANIEEGKQRKEALFMGPCLYSGIQALGEIRAASKEAFDLLKRLIQSENKGIRSAAAYAMATLDSPIEEKLKVLRGRQKIEVDERVKDFIQGSILVLDSNEKRK